MNHDRENSALDRRGLAKGRLDALASMTTSLPSPRTGMYHYLLLPIPAFSPSRLDRLLHPGAATRADSIREDS
jgi:hypothetical protein